MNMVRSTSFELEKLMGIETYLTDEDGIGGDLRVNVEDFRVNEISDFKVGQSGDYLMLKLTKENWETHHLLRDISRVLGISDERIGIAGTKDKRAVTTQLMSIKGVSEDTIRNVGLPRVQLTPIGRGDHDVGLGDLRGNEFDIIIRNIELSQPDIETRMKGISDKIKAAGGLPNYFGYQRFGIVRPVTHLVGKLLVQGDVEGAAMTYIARSFPGESPENIEARDMVWNTRDFKEGIKRYPFNLRYERTMMHYLIEHPGDYTGAFRSLSSKLSRLFVHGYQSYLFNKILSRRLLKGFSLVEPVEGDVVCFLDAHGEPDTSKQEIVTRKNLPDVKFLARKKRAYVTLPLIGVDTKIGEGEPGTDVKAILAEEGVTPQDFSVSQMTDLASAGLRREILLKADPTILAMEHAANLKFFLPKGCYATTVLREFMKTSPERMD